MKAQCEECGNLVYDDEDECWYCEAASMDEDDWARCMEGRRQESCPYYVNGNEYLIFRKQM